MEKKYIVYQHITPNGMVYIGVTKNLKNRWKPSHYKTTALYEYIKKYGWKNIKHIVIQDNLTKDDALKIEDTLIQAAKENGNCINSNRSGLFSISDRNTYYKVLYAENEESREKKKARSKRYRDTHKEEIVQYRKKVISTIEGKIYYRVANFNRYFPDKKIETPMEAKQKYLEFGLIPTYIKTDDFFDKIVA